MSNSGATTRDWLLNKLLKASRNLAEQQAQIACLQEQNSNAASAHTDALTRLAAAVDCAGRLAERVDDLEFEITQLKRVPPIAPNLTVIENPSRKAMNVLSVSSANGKTDITVARSKG